jgi:hypothetical protein
MPLDVHAARHAHRSRKTHCSRHMAAHNLRYTYRSQRTPCAGRAPLDAHSACRTRCSLRTLLAEYAAHAWQTVRFSASTRSSALLAIHATCRTLHSARTPLIVPEYRTPPAAYATRCTIHTSRLPHMPLTTCLRSLHTLLVVPARYSQHMLFALRAAELCSTHTSLAQQATPLAHATCRVSRSSPRPHSPYTLLAARSLP